MDSGTVTQCVALRQMKTNIEDIRAGNLYRVQLRDGSGNVSWSDWQVAMTDAKKKEDGTISVESDSVHLVMGKPEIMKLEMKMGRGQG